MLGSLNLNVGPALDKLSQAAECDAFMERVAIPRVAVACDSLMTLRHLGYGGLALSAKGNPIAKASSMVERVYAQSESVEWAHAHPWPSLRPRGYAHQMLPVHHVVMTRTRRRDVNFWPAGAQLSW